MIRIGTHNSASGEAPKGLLSWLLTPFARCQSKTLEEQYESGCRYFDLRADAKWRLCHGLWKSRKTLRDAVSVLASKHDTIYIMITFEGELSEVNECGFVTLAKEMVDECNYDGGDIRLAMVNVKKPTWRIIYHDTKCPTYVGAFKNLDGSTWHTYLPIPWLWKKLYYNKPTFSEETFKLVDFL